jgi:CitMHS family citrate-Mg2+:H+ or citrate-Ca2+:H+ symporter
MLAWLGVFTIVAMLALILSRRTSPLIALVVSPIPAVLLVRRGGALNHYIVAGVREIAPVVAMFVFAILFFGIITDAGVLKPIISRMLQLIGERPVRIIPVSALLALLVHLDGSGAVVFLVTIPALLPLYDRVGIDRRILACVVSMAAGVNFLPWTGPTLRASAVLHVSPTQLFLPLIGVQGVGLLFVFAVAFWFGLRQERKLASVAPADSSKNEQAAIEPLPQRFWINIALIVVVLAGVISGRFNPAVVFMLGTVVALLINFPGLEAQQEQVVAHAKAAITMAAILLAAGSFIGIMRGSGMLAAMATLAVRHISAHEAKHIPFILGLISMPLSLLFDPDSFYFGVLPVIAGTAQSMGTPGIQVAQAALLGQMTTGFPVSPLTPATFLVTGLSGVELAKHQRFSIPWLFAASVLMTLAAVLFGVIPL